MDSTVANYSLVGHTGCCYDSMIKDTCTIINNHVQYFILDLQRRLETKNALIKMLFCFFVYLLDSIRIIDITLIGL